MSASDKGDLAQDRTDLAEDRTLLAHERSFASWIRTGMNPRPSAHRDDVSPRF